MGATYRHWVLWGMQPAENEDTEKTVLCLFITAAEAAAAKRVAAVNFILTDLESLRDKLLLRWK